MACMEAPGVTRRRRPFLAPIWLTALFATALLVTVTIFYVRATTTTVIVIRHAEKQFGTIEDPPLSPAGELRAQRLAQLLGQDAKFGAVQGIYASDTRRAQMTVAVLAERLRLPVAAYRGTESPAALARRVRREHRGAVSLIVGHRDSVPELVRRLARRTDVPAIDEDEYTTMYLVSVPDIGRASVVRLRY